MVGEGCKSQSYLYMAVPAFLVAYFSEGCSGVIFLSERGAAAAPAGSWVVQYKLEVKTHRMVEHIWFS